MTKTAALLILLSLAGAQSLAANPTGAWGKVVVPSSKSSQESGGKWLTLAPLNEKFSDWHLDLSTGEIREMSIKLSANISTSQFFSTFSKNLKLNPDQNVMKEEEEKRYTDEQGFTHSRYQQYFLGLPVLGADATLHGTNPSSGATQANRILYALTHVVPSLEKQFSTEDMRATLSKQEACSIAETMILRMYPPEDPAIQREVPRELPREVVASKPAECLASLAISTKDYSMFPKDARVVWNIPEIETENGSWAVEIGANNAKGGRAGEVVNISSNVMTLPPEITPDLVGDSIASQGKRMDTATVAFLAHPWEALKSRLMCNVGSNPNLSCLAPIMVFENLSHPEKFEVVFDDDNYYGQGADDIQKRTAVNIMYYVQKMLEYLAKKFKFSANSVWKGVDGQGKVTIKAYDTMVNDVDKFCGKGNGACADPVNTNRMIFGKGLDGQTISHEMTHLVIYNTAHLKYNLGKYGGRNQDHDDPSALHEGFAELFGVLFDDDLNKADTLFSHLKSPSTYGGFYYVGRKDCELNYCYHSPGSDGVSMAETVECEGNTSFCDLAHNNGRLILYWFNLLSKNKQSVTEGINDLPLDKPYKDKNKFKVQGIGKEDATQIAFATMRSLSSTATFMSARQTSLTVAGMMFKDDKTKRDYIIKNLSEAWYAVGVGEKYDARLYLPKTGSVDINPSPVKVAWGGLPLQPLIPENVSYWSPSSLLLGTASADENPAGLEDLKNTEVEISTDPEFDDPDKEGAKCTLDPEETQANGEAFCSASFELKPKTTYFWHVRGNGEEWGATQQLTTGNKKVAKVTPIGPQGEIDYPDGDSLEFKWNKADGASSYKFRICRQNPLSQEGRCDLFDSGILNDISDTSYHSDKYLLDEPAYCWGVVGTNEGGDGGTLEPSDLTTCYHIKAQTKLIWPKGETLSYGQADAAFKWEPIKGAAKYEVYYYNNAEPTKPVKVTVDKDVTSLPMVEATKYVKGGFWYVRPLFGPKLEYGGGAWETGTWNVQTPGEIHLQSPDDGAFIDYKPVAISISWESGGFPDQNGNTYFSVMVKEIPKGGSAPSWDAMPIGAPLPPGFLVMNNLKPGELTQISTNLYGLNKPDTTYAWQVLMAFPNEINQKYVAKRSEVWTIHTSVAPHCGDGSINEDYYTKILDQCDDGNLTDGDGINDNCDSNCKPTGCGSGKKTGSEQCDDGNKINEDYCKNDCTNNFCGDGVPGGPNEQCDHGKDKNGTPGDSCAADCKLKCGDGVKEDNEECGEPGLTCPASSDCEKCQCKASVCGNKVKEANEVCDDPNGLNGTPTRCNSTCDGITSQKCGNGLPLEPGEQCEPPNTSTCDKDCKTICTPAGTPSNLHFDKSVYEDNTPLNAHLPPPIVPIGAALYWDQTQGATGYILHFWEVSHYVQLYDAMDQILPPKEWECSVSGPGTLIGACINQEKGGSYTVNVKAKNNCGQAGAPNALGFGLW